MKGIFGDVELDVVTRNYREFGLNYNREESMVFCLISGLMWRTEREYECYRELQTGKGSADLIYAPKRSMNLPILLIEFKYGLNAEEAMNQIKEKEYFSRYRDGDYPNDVLLIGINYDPKTKELCINKLYKFGLIV